MFYIGSFLSSGFQLTVLLFIFLNLLFLSTARKFIFYKRKMNEQHKIINKIKLHAHERISMQEKKNHQRGALQKSVLIH